MWGVAGYSEGGFCAANIEPAVRHQVRLRRGAERLLRARPEPGAGRQQAGRQAARRQRLRPGHPALLARNTPDKYILKIPIGIEVQQFWLAAGALDAQDVQAAQYFQQVALTRVANMPLMIVPGGGHTAPVWRAAFKPMLAWMTTQLAQQVQHFAQVDKERAAAARGARPGVHRIPVKVPHVPVTRPTPLFSV